MRAIAERNAHPVEQFTSPSAALAALSDDPPGCLIVDLTAGVPDAMELHGHLDAAGTDLPMIVVASHADVPMAVAAVKQGVFMLLTKPCESEALSKSIAEALDFNAEQRQRREQKQALLARYATLSDDEQRVLKLIVAGQSNKAIASHLSMAVRTVEARRASVLRKMEADSIAELVRLTVGLPSP